MSTTTPSIIRWDFTHVLKGGNGHQPLVPLSEQWRSHLWTEVHSLSSVPTSELRKFFIQVVPGLPIVGGIYSTRAVEREFELRVWTSYGGVPEGLDDCLIEEDSTQIHSAFTRRQSNQLPGLISVEPEQWQDGDGGDEQHYRFGFHPFLVRYLSPASL